MKKSLVALAALAATSAFAQSSVTIDGYMDRAYMITDNTDNTKDTKTIASTAGTTTIGVKVREDLGGGLSTGLSINTDWSDMGGASQASGIATAQMSGFANSQSFIDLTSKTMGTLRLGTPNNFTLTNVTGIASPAFSTGVGSAYSSQFSIANGLGTGATGYVGTIRPQAAITNTANVGARAIRTNNTFQYSSPSFNGLSIHVGQSLKNDNATAASGTGNTVGITETALRYTKGPIDAMYSTIKYTVGANGTRQVTLGATGAVANSDMTAGDNTQSLLGVSYAVMPNMKLHFGSGSTKSSSNTWKGNSTQYGVTYNMGQWDFMAQMAKFNDKSTTDDDRKMTGLGVNYNLSKTARAYLRYESVNWGSNQAVATGSEQKRTAFGVSKAF